MADNFIVLNLKKTWEHYFANLRTDHSVSFGFSNCRGEKISILTFLEEKDLWIVTNTTRIRSSPLGLGDKVKELA